ncbi:MAG: alpha/beta hydrolase [Clostridiales bacterium]|nr:alpha/beta hydrolase [Clostridiales bacterium]
MVFAYALGACLDQWEKQFEHFKEYHIVAISLQGLGKSDKRDVYIHYYYLETLADSSIPILIIKSPNDKDINRYLKKYNEFFELDHVKVMELKDTGHLCNMERPDAYNKLVMKAVQGGSID